MTDTYIVDPLLWGLSYRHTALEGHAPMAMAGFFRSVFLIQRARSLSLQRLKNARELRHNREEGYKNATRGFAYQKCIGNSQCEIMRSISSSVAPFREKMIEIGRSQLGSHHVVCEVPCTFSLSPCAINRHMCMAQAPAFDPFCFIQGPFPGAQ